MFLLLAFMGSSVVRSRYRRGRPQRLAQARIVLRKGRMAVQILQEDPRQQPADEGHACQVKHVHGETFLVNDARHDVVGHVAEVHEPGPGSCTSATCPTTSCRASFTRKVSPCTCLTWHAWPSSAGCCRGSS